MAGHVMSIIEGSSVSVKTMSDGTLRLSIDIEPKNAQAAFALFGAPGRAVALAALKDGSFAFKPDDEQPVQPVQKEAEPAPTPKGGPLARLAGQWCNDPAFQFWVARAFAGQWNCGTNVLASERCAMIVRDLCEVDSRAELDSDPAAAQRFNTRIRLPYMNHMKFAA